MVTEEPIAPLVGAIEVMLGADVSVKVGPAGLETPPAAVTTTAPFAPAGTTAVTLLVVQLLNDVAGTVPNFTALPVPWALKFAPAMTTEEPTAPLVGAIEVMLAADVSVNVGPAGLETPPAAVTTTAPFAPAGTTAVTLLVVQLLNDVAGTVPNFTALPVPCALKFAPAMTTEEPTAPLVGAIEVMLGADVTVNVGPVVLTWPPTVTATSPLGAPVGTVAVILEVLQFVIVVACVPPNLTVLPVTCADRKLVPAITIEEPNAPEVGVRLVTVGNPVPRGNVICESKFPFSVPSRSTSPLKVLDEVAVRLTPTHR